MSGKRILVITHNFVRFPDDPAGQFLYTLYRQLETQHTFYILCPHQRGLKYSEKLGKLNIVRFQYWLESGEDLAYEGDMQEKVAKSLVGKIKFIFLILFGTLSAVRLIISKRIDIIHCHWWIPGGISGWIASILTGRGLILTSHGTDIILLEKKPGLRKIADKVFKRASAITTVSNFLKDKLSNTIEMKKMKIYVFPMPYDAEKLETADDKVEREKGYILSVGRLNYQKGQDYLIKACGILKEKGYSFRVDIIGGGPERERFEDLIRQLGLGGKIKLLGPLPHNEVIRHYKRAEIFVLPSVDEGFGMVFVEALASGTAIIGADSGGVKDIIKDGKTGLLVPPEDEVELAKAIMKFLDDGDFATRTAEAGRDFVLNNFTPSATAEKLNTIYRSVR